MRHIIVGAGAAGIAAAKAIRAVDCAAEIILIGEEAFSPYRRYLLTDYLCGAVDEDDLFQFSEDYLRDKNISYRKGQRVTRVRPRDKALDLEHREVLRYDKLLVATGRCPNLGPVLRPFRQCVRSYHALEDVLVLREQLGELKHVIVSGHGVNKLDLIHGLCRLDKAVTYIVKGKSLEVPFLEPASEKAVDASLAAKGVEVIYDDRVIAVCSAERGYRVKTFNGRVLETDLVFASQSHEPNLACIRDAGIEAKSGILVDLRMRTTAEDVYAAGDCVEIYHPVLRNYWINFGWPNAIDQGTVAGRNMAGLDEEYRINETLVFNLLGKPLAARWWS